MLKKLIEKFAIILFVALITLLINYGDLVFNSQSSILIAPTYYVAAYEMDFHNSHYTFLRSILGEPIVVCHGCPDCNLLYIDDKWLFPSDIIKILIENNGVQENENVLIICCYPGDKRAGEKMGVKYYFCGNEKQVVGVSVFYPFLFVKKGNK